MQTVDGTGMVCESYPFQTTNVGNVCFFRLPIPNKMCEEMLVQFDGRRILQIGSWEKKAAPT